MVFPPGITEETRGETEHAMQYSEGRIGRVFVVRFDEGEDLLQGLHRFIAEKEVRTGYAMVLGALREARLVTGPEKAVIPPVPHWETASGGWEVLGIATVYPGDLGEPALHLHATVGRGKEALTGCIREVCRAYLMVEAIVVELEGISFRRLHDPSTGLHLPVTD
jgi:hypothetical protein